MSTIHNDLPGMAEALEARRRIDVGLTWLRAHRKPGELAAGERKLVRITAREYLPAVRQVAEVDRLTLLRHRSDTKRRLQRGVDVTGERADDRWVQLLAEVEVLTDALLVGCPGHTRGPLNRILGRIALAVRPEGCDARTHVEAPR